MSVRSALPGTGTRAAAAAMLIVLLASVGYRWDVPLWILWAVPPLLAIGLVGAGRQFVVWAAARASDGRDVLRAWSLTRLLVLVVGLLAVVYVGVETGAGRFRVSDHVLANLPARWDAGWYLNIARYGYTWEPGGFDQQQRIAFFPAFPLTMRYAADVLTLIARVLDTPDWLGGGNGRYLWAGTLICLLSSLIGARYVARIARRHGGPGLARRSVWLLLAYPFAVFFNAPYTEGLFLLAASGALYHAHDGRPGPASAFGVLAGLTRPNGFLLSGAMAVGVLWRRRQGDDVAPAMWAAVVMPLVGVAAYSAFVYSLAGDPLAWMKAQAAWGNTFTVSGFWVAKWHHAVSAGARFVVEPFGLMSLMAVCLVGASAIPVGRQLGPGYASYVVLYLLPPLLVNLPAIGRMTVVLFPTFIWLAGRAHTPRRFGLVLALFLLAQAICAVHFFTWRPLM